jgi:DNA-directed RNA polymerase subunit RPC12/RpoP
MKYWLKKCPKCSGDLREDLDTLGSYVTCLQCGYMLTHLQEAALITSGVIDEPLVREEEPQHRALYTGRQRVAG